ncbi:DUF2752 domain-containing protein [Lutimonas sp.]|uniref:DUF2752 domain-containing protein n=1 Tax=Lutimonas sp. TaxID=1872403 RepID=UPI003D9BDB5C
MKQRNSLYSILLIACFAGFGWLYFETQGAKTEQVFAGGCLFKHATDLPCPSCGSTRSIVTLLEGKYTESFLINPLGYLIALVMVLAPLWIVVDIITKRATLLLFYKKMEYQLMKPKNAIIMVILISINWLWNINKGL